MTLNEQKRFAEKFMARRTSRIVAVQSGFNEQFAADPYNGDTQEETVDSSNGAPTDTQQVDPVDQGIDGTVNREGGVDEAWQSDLRDAITHIQRAIENVGVNRSVDDGTLAGLNLLASTAQALRELPSGVSIAKAVANADGVTRQPLVVKSNADESVSGVRNPYVDVADLENSARKLTNLSARIVNVDRL